MVSKRILSFIVAGLMLSGSLPAFASGNPNVTTQPTANAESSSDTSVSDAVCDPLVFERIKQKGWMEAQRENYINQSIIKRPVNTFAATCFDQQIGVAINRLGVAEREDPNSDGSPETMRPFQEGVLNSSGSIVGNLIGPTSGGKPLLPSAGNGTSTVYQEYQMPPASGGSINCNAMNQIWDNVSCSNMAGGNLPSLADVGLPDAETRTPGRPESSCNLGKNDVSGTAGSDRYNYQTAISQIYSTGAGLENYDNLDLHLCKTLPYSQLQAVGCPQKCSFIEITGSVRSDGKNAMSCTNNGCSYDEERGECVPSNQ